jgi:hypothetical protein
LKSVTCVALVRKATDEIRITNIFKSFGVKTNELVLTSNKLLISRARFSDWIWLAGLQLEHAALRLVFPQTFAFGGTRKLSLISRGAPNYRVVQSVYTSVRVCEMYE